MKLVEDGVERWCAVSRSLREDDTWDVIECRSSRAGIVAYLEGIQTQQIRMVKAGVG